MAVKTKERVTEGRRNAAYRKILEGIKAKNPKRLLLTDDIVAEATPEDHPLHVEFEWDDSVAAHEHRKAQANALIRRVYIIEDSTPIPAFVSLRPDREDGGGYRQTSEVLDDEGLMQQLMNDAKRDLEAWSERYKMLGGLVSRVAKAAKIKLPKQRKAK